MTLSINILGSLLIESDECRLGKVPKKARALLAYLAAQGGQAVSRERLADLLWPYQGSEEARHSLRNCLLELRKALGPSAARHLVAEFAHCRLASISMDLDDFERLSRSQRRAELQAAADLYRGELLADFHIASEPFQEWLAAERDRTLGVVCDVLHRLTIEHDLAGEHEAAIQSGRRLVALDSLSEYGQRALMRAYARAGRRGEALRQYKSCAETLKRELGVTPDGDTRALADEITRSGGAEAPLMTLGTVGDPNPAMSNPQWPCLLPGIEVAIVPVRNLTGDLKHQYLVDAVTDDLITDLLRHGRGFSLKTRANEPAGTGRPLRILGPERAHDYIVTGSIQRSSSGKLRVNIRITDWSTSEYLWGGRHEFGPEDLISLQTRITQRISRQLHGLLLREASRRAAALSRHEIEASECLTEAAQVLARGMRAELSAEAQRWYLRALAGDPRNVEALTGFTRTCQHLVSNPWWGDPRAVAAASDLGREAAAIVLSIAPGHAEAHCMQGMLYSAAGRLHEAEASFQRAVTMDQGLGIAHGFAGYNAAFLGHAEETPSAIGRAMQVDPVDWRHSIWYFFGGFAELLLGRTEASIGLLEKSLERNRSYGSALLFLAAALSLSGRRKEAAETAAAFRTQYPDYRANAFKHLWLSRSNSPAYQAQIHPLFDKICALGVAN